MTLDSLEDAYRSYIETINNYNKAQLQLLLLLDGHGCPTDSLAKPASALRSLPAAIVEKQE
jgi:hypothetical protein